jgi:hypothetical protein
MIFFLKSAKTSAGKENWKPFFYIFYIVANIIFLKLIYVTGQIQKVNLFQIRIMTQVLFSRKKLFLFNFQIYFKFSIWPGTYMLKLEPKPLFLILMSIL